MSPKVTIFFQMPAIQSILSNEDVPLVITSGAGPTNAPTGVYVHGLIPNAVGTIPGVPLPQMPTTGNFPRAGSMTGVPSAAAASGGGGSNRGSHVSVRDSVTGPIRSSHKSRIDTSPYGSDRSAQGGYHLSPPDPSWRRVHSDSAIHQSMAGGGGGGGGVATATATVPGGHPGAQVIAVKTSVGVMHHQQQHQLQQHPQMQQHHVNHNGGHMSPLQAISPTTVRRGKVYYTNESDCESIQSHLFFLQM